jgi:hypothetical protein
MSAIIKNYEKHADECARLAKESDDRTTLARMPRADSAEAVGVPHEVGIHAVLTTGRRGVFHPGAT